MVFLVPIPALLLIAKLSHLLYTYRMEVRMGKDIECARLLREAGFKATFGRVRLLETLQKARKPVSPEALAKELKKYMDQATVYRALEVLTKAGLIRRIDFGHAHAHYEFAGQNHHHHVICDSCGTVEDVELHEEAELERAALRAARSFTSVRTHALEFFGTCRACA